MPQSVQSAKKQYNNSKKYMEISAVSALCRHVGQQHLPPPVVAAGMPRRRAAAGKGGRLRDVDGRLTEADMPPRLTAAGPAATGSGGRRHASPVRAAATAFLAFPFTGGPF
jgi:hypothetical protein